MSQNASALRDAEAAAAPPARSARSEPRKGSLHQDAVAELRKLIVSGEFPPGERLREVAVSQRLGMSRTPLREAFRTLAAEGLVDLLPNRSVVVSELDPTEAADVFALLGSMEALAAQQACRRMSDEQIAELGALQAEMVRSFERGDRQAYNEINRRVHELMVEGSNNLSLILAWRLILPRADRARRLNTLDRSSWTEFMHKHQQIYDAMAARNAGLLAELMQDHFDHAVDRMTRRMKGRGKDASRD
jgi:DNA-binding GntR family transcriptional regulator